MLEYYVVGRHCYLNGIVSSIGLISYTLKCYFCYFRDILPFNSWCHLRHVNYLILRRFSSFTLVYLRCSCFDYLFQVVHFD